MVVPELQGKAIALVMTGIPVALGLGVPAGAFLANLTSWRGAFLAMTIITVLLLVPDQPGLPRDRSTGVGATLATPGVIAVLAVVLLFILAHTIGYTYIAAYLENIGLGYRVDLVLLANAGVLALPWALVVLLVPTLAVVLASRAGFPGGRAAASDGSAGD